MPYNGTRSFFLCLLSCSFIMISVCLSVPLSLCLSVCLSSSSSSVLLLPSHINFILTSFPINCFFPLAALSTCCSFSTFLLCLPIWHFFFPTLFSLILYSGIFLILLLPVCVLANPAILMRDSFLLKPRVGSF